MVEYVKVSKSGASLVISLPPAIREALQLAWHDHLELVVHGEVLVARKIRPDETARRFAMRGAKG